MRGIKRVTFDNGLTLLMEKRSYRGNVIISIATKNGSMYERAGQSGINHFLEHMFFLSNGQRTSEEITRELESAGADINGFTDRDYMCFYADTLPGEILKTLDILYEIVVSDGYDKEEFSKEKRNILSEIKDYQESYAEYLYYGLFLPTLFRGTPLEKALEGRLETVRNLTLSQIVAHKKESLSPNRPMLIVVVGDHDEEEVSGKIQKTFGSLPKGKPAPVFNINYSNKSARKIEKRRGLKQAHLAMGFQVPSYAHKDTLKLLLLKAILTDGMSSRLFRELRSKRGIGYGISSELESFEAIGSLCFMVDVEIPDRLDEVEGVISVELDNLKRNLVAAWELEKAKNMIVKDFNRQLLQPKSRAQQLTTQEFQEMPYDFSKSEYFVRRLSARSLREAARKYFTDEYVLCALVPK